MVALVLVGVGLGELGHRAIEARSRSEVTGDGDAIAGAGMGAGERPSAQVAVDLQPLWLQLLDRFLFRNYLSLNGFY